MRNIVGILLVLLGLANIFYKDLAWKVTTFRYRIQGKKSKRTEAWETGTTVGGIFLVIVGVLLLIG